ncbi:MAG: type I glyceraldehyde-3-phosphate dehydrogenase [Rickettsiales bacterium]|jgi:glyceraldehyde 3-phosphate dehydrogenase|nr:type I glyceraldehyde-3-phosphate dehydrogenase [Rickettsiales bacterium]
MTTKIAINGFGRIGRCVFRAFFENQSKYKDLEIVAINDLAPLETNLYLLKYDSAHGKFKETAEIKDGNIVVGGKTIKVCAERDANNLPWKELGIDIVLECTGIFLERDKAAPHINAGAKKVMMSGPTKTPDTVKTIVVGVNDDQLTASDDMVSNASCTTNCLAPVAKLLDASVGIEKGHMTTIHSYTNDQNILDRVHSDLRRSRAGAVNMIPTSTGAAKAVGLVLPQLKGKLDGVSIRVPTPDVSFVDLSFVSKRDTSVEEINDIIKNGAADKALQGVLAVTSDQVVSIDLLHDPHSSTFDTTQTKVLNKNFVRIGAWYDNEWGYSNRMLDLAQIWAAKK